MEDWIRVFLHIAATLLILWLVVRVLRLSLRGISALLRGLNEVLWFVLRIPLLPFRMIRGIIRLFRKGGASPALSTSPKKRLRGQLQGAPTIHWPPKGKFDFEVVGESFYQEEIYRQFLMQKEMETAGETLVATLLPENENPHDANAVAVLINDEIVGHMCREDAESFRRRLALHQIPKKTSTCNVLIIEHERSTLTRNGRFYSVWLDMQPFRR